MWNSDYIREIKSLDYDQFLACAGNECVVPYSEAMDLVQLWRPFEWQENSQYRSHLPIIDNLVRIASGISQDLEVLNFLVDSREAKERDGFFSRNFRLFNDDIEMRFAPLLWAELELFEAINANNRRAKKFGVLRDVKAWNSQGNDHYISPEIRNLDTNWSIRHDREAKEQQEDADEQNPTAPVVEEAIEEP